MFDSIVIQNAQLPKDLGISVEPDLKFKKHISDIINRSNQRSALIFRSFLSHNQNKLLRAYKTYVRPLMEYASSIWSPSLITQIMALEALRKDSRNASPISAPSHILIDLLPLNYNLLNTDASLLISYSAIKSTTKILPYHFPTFSNFHIKHLHAVTLFTFQFQSSNQTLTNPPLHIELCQHGILCLKTL